MIALGAAQLEQALSKPGRNRREPQTGAGSSEERQPGSPIHGKGPPVEVTVYSNGRTIRLQGRTRARFRSNFHTENVQYTPAEGCQGCRRSPCVRATGTLIANFTVSTHVTLPRIPRGLTPCQRQRVRDAIDNVLAPHEQQHVAAFNTYAGTVTQPFDFIDCRHRVNGRIRSMFQSEEQRRRQAAQAASDALDPFYVDIDLDCEDTP